MASQQIHLFSMDMKKKSQTLPVNQYDMGYHRKKVKVALRGSRDYMYNQDFNLIGQLEGDINKEVDERMKFKRMCINKRIYGQNKEGRELIEKKEKMAVRQHESKEKYGMMINQVNKSIQEVKLQSEKEKQENGEEGRLYN